MATFKWTKSRRKGDLYEPGSLAGTVDGLALIICEASSTLTLFVPVRLDVPVGVDITGLVLFHTSGLDLLKTPLRQVDVTSAEVASKVDVSQAEGSGQSPQMGIVPRRCIVYDLDLPVILSISDGKVAVTGNFMVSLGDRSGDLVRVEVATSLRVNETDDIAVANVSDFLGLGIIVRLLSVGVEKPVVVGILVVVASDLLLRRALGVGLHVRMQKTTTVAHILESSARTHSNLQWAVLANLSAPKIGLEKRGHLRITRTAVLQNEEVDVEREHIDNEGNHNQANHSEHKVSGKLNLSIR
jgi:hypothetical protein